ncbi:MAG: tRNA epoxyqueuosine(34) reductase QueG [Verrucomicrobia bacterium]|nr:tRNA epoxyqueuosine(34) reductase QueG [Verrucomicrobiota bacterium]
MDPRQAELRRRLGALGFDDVRFASFGPSTSSGQALRDWLAQGLHADMHWMERSAEKRLDPQLVLPGAKSIVMLGVNYWSPQAPGHPAWARYALHEDYHDTIKPALIAAGRAIEELFDVSGLDYRYYVDTGPVLEREWAARAGIGFVGKNAMLISQTHGNWLLLAAILTRVELAADQPRRKQNGEGGVGLWCGKCTRCLDACPTQAFRGPGVVDARRCISYQTIENKGIIPRELRAGIGPRIFGCDVCLEVCPWNRFAREGRRLLLAVRHELTQLSLQEILEITPAKFAELFRRTPIKRLKPAGLLRNACVVAGNSDDRSLLPVLVRLAAQHESPLVRAHAVWAVRRLGGGEQLAAARAVETDASVLAEYAESTAVP